MRIGIVLSSTPGYSETFFKSKIKGLKSNGYEPVLFCREYNSQFNLCPVRIQPRIFRSLPIQSFTVLLTLLKLVPHINRVIRFIRIERSLNESFTGIIKKIYLNSHMLSAQVDWLHFGFGTLAIGSESVARAINAKMAVSFRGFDISVYPLKNPNCYDKLWTVVDKVHVISDDILVAAVDQGLPENVKTQKIVPAIDLSLFDYRPTLNPNEDLIFMTVGRLHWKKGYVDTLMALSQLKQKVKEFKYYIVGKGQDYERIAFTARELDLYEEVEFLGQLSQEEIISYLNRTSIYLQYSIQEGFCNSVLEAQAMGKLCIVSDAEGLSENVLNNESGWVVPKGRPELLADKIRSVLDLSVEEKNKTIQYSIDRVREKFSIDQQINDFIQFYEEQ